MDSKKTELVNGWHPERLADLKLYSDIYRLVCEHAQGRDKILKAVRFKYNPDGTLCKHQTFEWHWRKLKKQKPHNNG